MTELHEIVENDTECRVEISADPAALTLLRSSALPGSTMKKPSPVVLFSSRKIRSERPLHLVDCIRTCRIALTSLTKTWLLTWSLGGRFDRRCEGALSPWTEIRHGFCSSPNRLYKLEINEWSTSKPHCSVLAPPKLEAIDVLRSGGTECTSPGRWRVHMKSKSCDLRQWHPTTHC